MLRTKSLDFKRSMIINMDIYQIIIKEIENVLLSVDRQEIKVLKQEILMARRIYVAGAGRSGLVAGSFAMRLCQLGLCLSGGGSGRHCHWRGGSSYFDFRLR